MSEFVVSESTDVRTAKVTVRHVTGVLCSSNRHFYITVFHSCAKSNKYC